MSCSVFWQLAKLPRFQPVGQSAAWQCDRLPEQTDSVCCFCQLMKAACPISRQKTYKMAVITDWPRSQLILLNYYVGLFHAQFDCLHARFYCLTEWRECSKSGPAPILMKSQKSVLFNKTINAISNVKTNPIWTFTLLSFLWSDICLKYIVLIL